MESMGGADVGRAVAAMVEVLTPHTADRDWKTRAGSLEWSCWTTAAHVAHDLLAYAGQVTSGAAHGYLPLDLVVRPGSSAREVLDVVVACSRLLSCALDAAGPDARSWHWGPTDPSGFAALGVNEVVVHTVDICRGLGVEWAPPASLCAGVLRRLFPDVPPGDPVPALLWATGRGDLPGRPHRSSWIPRAATG
jgi:hypothetical protein